MSLDDFIDTISGLLDEVPAEGLNPLTDFKGLKCWDSLAVLTVTDTVDMECGVLLSKNDYQNCQTLEDLYELICARKKD
ncbi:MAG: phosphopantetheine-binding protein [Coraliomargaritaceae bacterium]